jgi:hypothetical protein
MTTNKNGNVKRLFSRFGEIEVIDSVGMDDAG